MMSKNISITEARKLLPSLPLELEQTRDTVAITNRGQKVLAVLSWDVYEAIMETLEILDDSELMKAIREDVLNVKAGQPDTGIPWEDVKAKLGL